MSSENESGRDPVNKLEDKSKWVSLLSAVIDGGSVPVSELCERSKTTRFVVSLKRVEGMFLVKLL